MLSTVEGKQIYRVAYEKKFNELMKSLNKKHYNVIVDELNKVINTSNVLPQVGFRNIIGKVQFINLFGKHVILMAKKQRSFIVKFFIN
ncbi:hypothetical protein WBS46_25410 [Bacillus albus]|uniref:hypothetical protein n=1 Tax=Bacillus cereus group TaxID=86661 RepID=UPI0022E2CC2B|nr:hypothetical protein [Bacillus cereus group sp. Bc177]MDA2323983.1 hypothetical protein [Bacillus cereus group sp. Bc177]